MYHSRISCRVFFISLMCIFLLSDICIGQVVCPGTYGGHLQGITTDNTNIYWSFTTSLVKTDTKGNLLVETSVPNHHGDITFHDGKIYVAVNLGKFNKEKGFAKSWVYVYDSKKLNLISKYNIPDVVHGAGGIEYHKNHFFVVGGLPKGHKANYVYEYDKNFKFIKKYTIKSGYTLKGIQTICFSQGYWWFGCYGKPPELLKTDDSFKLLGKYNFDCALGIAGFSGDTILIGRKLGKERHRGQVLPAKIDQTKGIPCIQCQNPPKPNKR